MRSKLSLVIAITAIVIAGALPSHAGSETGTYVAGPYVRCCNQLHDAAGVGIGGFQFTPNRTPKKVILDDLNGYGIGFSACQENDQLDGEVPGNCGGEGDDVSVSSCSVEGGLDISESGFKAKAPITIFIFTADVGCPQIGTAGTVKMTW